MLGLIHYGSFAAEPDKRATAFMVNIHARADSAGAYEESAIDPLWIHALDQARALAELIGPSKALTMAWRGEAQTMALAAKTAVAALAEAEAISSLVAKSARPRATRAL